MSAVSASVAEEEMWQRSCFLTRLVASSVRVSETAGDIIKAILSGGDLKIVNKCATVGGQLDPQTEADRAAQYCIVHSLQNKFGDKLNIIGEEEETSFTPELESRFLSDVLALDALCPPELRDIKPEDVVVWVDPLDGTGEVAQAAKSNNTALLRQVTVLIGIGYKGRSVAGVIHQPYYQGNTGRTIWAIRGLGAHGVVPAPASSDRVIVTTRSHSTQTVSDALASLESNGLASSIERVGGAGYKVIRVLEGAAAYVFASPGCKKWDTAAPEAVIEAAGGRLTDISGRPLNYSADVQLMNSGGVLATSSWVDHQAYVDTIPQALKDLLPEFTAKQ